MSITTTNATFTFEAILPLWKDQSYLSFYFETSKFVRRYRCCCLFAMKYVISLSFCSLTCNCISLTYVVLFSLWKTSFVLWLSRSDYRWPFLLLILRRLNTYTVHFVCVEEVQKSKNYLSVSTLTSKNISSILSVVWYPLNTFFLPFSGNLNWKCINHSYLLAGHTLNPPSTHYFSVCNGKKMKRHDVLRPSNDESYLCSYLETSKIC